MRFVDVPESLHKRLRQWVDRHAEGLASEDFWNSEYKLSDLSVGACYVETKSPYPEGSVVQLSVKVGGMEVNADGTIQVTHPGIGMGIELASGTATRRADVQSLLTLLTSRPGILPELTITPLALIAGDEYKSMTSSERKHDDPLLQLLWNHESLSQKEFLHELRQQRTMQEVAPA